MVGALLCVGRKVGRLLEGLGAAIGADNGRAIIDGRQAVALGGDERYLKIALTGIEMAVGDDERFLLRADVERIMLRPKLRQAVGLNFDGIKQTRARRAPHERQHVQLPPSEDVVFAIYLTQAKQVVTRVSLP